jgi:hypothetical protein
MIALSPRKPVTARSIFLKTQNPVIFFPGAVLLLTDLSVVFVPGQPLAGKRFADAEPQSVYRS